jgi:hypothetical protein
MEAKEISCNFLLLVKDMYKNFFFLKKIFNYIPYKQKMCKEGTDQFSFTSKLMVIIREKEKKT